MSIRISALKMQLTLSAQVERTCNFKILSLRATVCVFSFWKVSILSKRKTHIDKWRTCWFSGKLEMGETTYMKNFNQPIKTVNSISSGRQAATSSHGCLRQPEETYFGNFCFRNEPFLWNPKCPSYLEPKLIILFSLFTRVGKQKCSNYSGNSSHPCQLYTNIWRNAQDSVLHWALNKGLFFFSC